VRVVGVNMGEGRAQVLNWVNELGITYDLLIDHDGRLAYQYMIRNLPTTFFIRRDGSIQQIASGIVSADQLTAEITMLIAK
jgi:peroxiredoxin